MCRESQMSDGKKVCSHAAHASLTVSAFTNNRHQFAQLITTGTSRFPVHHLTRIVCISFIFVRSLARSLSRFFESPLRYDSSDLICPVGHLSSGEQASGRSK
jgi:hypothetical protein